jgi:TolB protein
MTPWLAADEPKPASPPDRLFFTSQGKIGFMHADGSALEYLHFSIPNQNTWQPGPIFPDGKRVILLSMEPRKDGPGKPFDEYYTQTPTHLWIYDLQTRELVEIANRERLAPFQTPAALIDDDHLLVQVVRNRVGQIFHMNLDGSDPQEWTRAGEGLPYGFSVSPDRQRIAFHIAGPEGYQVFTASTLGQDRIKVASSPGHLFFGTDWSPDGQWITYVDCQPQIDPGHDWADLCVGKADGSLHRRCTSEGAMWFAATYGNATTRGGGSNIPVWTSRGTILFPKRSPNAQVAWVYRQGEPDLDHFNRRYQPEQARGSVHIVEFDPNTGTFVDLTEPTEGIWDFRATPSPDGKSVLFCRAKVGEAPAIWIMDADGSHQKMLTRGLSNLGADHPRWIPATIRTP